MSGARWTRIRIQPVGDLEELEVTFTDEVLPGAQLAADVQLVESSSTPLERTWRQTGCTLTVATHEIVPGEHWKEVDVWTGTVTCPSSGASSSEDDSVVVFSALDFDTRSPHAHEFN